MIITPQDNPIIIVETSGYTIWKYHTQSSLHVVQLKADDRLFGLATVEDAFLFVNRQGWETSNEERIERRRKVYEFRTRNKFGVRPLPFLRRNDAK